MSQPDIEYRVIDNILAVRIVRKGRLMSLAKTNATGEIKAWVFMDDDTRRLAKYQHVLAYQYSGGLHHGEDLFKMLRETNVRLIESGTLYVPYTGPGAEHQLAKEADLVEQVYPTQHEVIRAILEWSTTHDDETGELRA